ncbi:uncharacterized protein LOC141740093 [Larus michahellis]|uniref:uncharacterized protein LOC141740093 n=1 Tax=Larus michahellis TaxID=119627 RepID=UPI003D9B6765
MPERRPRHPPASGRVQPRGAGAAAIARRTPPTSPRRRRATRSGATSRPRGHAAAAPPLRAGHQRPPCGGADTAAYLSPPAPLRSAPSHPAELPACRARAPRTPRQWQEGPGGALANGGARRAAGRARAAAAGGREAREVDCSDVVSHRCCEGLIVTANSVLLWMSRLARPAGTEHKTANERRNDKAILRQILQSIPGSEKSADLFM